MTVFSAVFTGAFVALAALFGLRFWEEKRGARVMPEMRLGADSLARRLKAFLEDVAVQLHRFPALLLLITRYFIHLGAKGFARFAKKMEEASHGIADRMSHKHRFQKKESQSKFLKEVTDHKNGLVKE